MRGWSHYNACRPHQAWTTSCRSRRPTGSRRSRPSNGTWWSCGCRPRCKVAEGGARPKQRTASSQAGRPTAGARVLPRRRRGAAARSSSTWWCRRRGTCACCREQFWLGPARAGTTVRFWASTEVITCPCRRRVKSVRSHLTVADLAKLAANGAVNAGAPPLPSRGGRGGRGRPDRQRGGTISLGGIGRPRSGDPRRTAGRRADRLGTNLLFFDLATRELLRTRPNPFTPAQILRLRGLRPAGPPPRTRPTSRSGCSDWPTTPA